MNRPTSPASVSSGAATKLAADGSVFEDLSALADGELDVTVTSRLWQADGDAVCATWASYQLIGDALRGGTPAASDGARVAAIMQRLRDEQAVPVSVPSAAPTVVAPRLEAANDSVFRWKMIAGFASLAAVVAVAWNMAGPGDMGGALGPQLAQAPAPALTVPVPVQTAPAVALNVAPVVVAGEQGPVLRDARLEELMAAHRQAGGMSALQMPAGFLRNAAFDLPEGQR